MAVSVTIKAKAWGDKRFAKLAQLGGFVDFEHAIIKTARVWEVCTELGSHTPPVIKIRIALDRDNGEQLLIDCDLAERLPSGEVRVKGCEGVTDWYGELPQQQREAGKKRAEGAKRDNRGHFVATPPRPAVTSAPVQRSSSGHQRAGSSGPAAAGQVSGTKSADEPARSGTLDKPLAALDSSGPAVVQRSPAQLQDQDPDGAALPLTDPVASEASGSGSPERGLPGDRDPEPTATPAPARVAPVPGAQPAGPAGRLELQRVLINAHAAAYNRVIESEGLTVPAMRGAGLGEDAERQLRELMIGLPTLDGFEACARHALAVLEAEAVKKHTVRFFGGSMWRPDNFDRAKRTQLAEVTPTSRDIRHGQAPASSSADHERDRLQGEDF